MYDLIKNNINDIKKELINQLDIYPIKKIIEFIDNISKINGTIYCGGIGKSDTLCKLLSDLLKSINIKSHTLNITNLNHGDIGAVDCDNDILIIFSKSGNTIELKNICENNKNFKIYGVFCNKQADLIKYCDNFIILPFINEIKNNIDIIPSNSCISYIIFINLLISGLIEKNNIKLENYEKNHIGGNIGKQLLILKNIMITDFPKKNINTDIDINDILIDMIEFKIGCYIFINNENKYVGLITDADLRKLYHMKLDIKKIINTNSFVIKNKNLRVLDIYENIKLYSYIPILDNDEIIGLISRDSIL